MAKKNTDPSTYTSTSKTILGRTKEKKYDVNKGTITKSVTDKKGNLVRSKVKNLDPGTVQFRLNNEKEYREGEFDPSGSNGSFAKKGGSVIKGSNLRRQSSISGLRSSRKHK